MEKEFYISYEGVIKIKAKNKKDAEKKFWEIMKDKADVINSIEKNKTGVDKTSTPVIIKV